MSKLIYIIFLLPVIELAAMEQGGRYTAQAKKLVVVANILNQGVMAQVFNSMITEPDDSGKIWIARDTAGRIEVSPPKSPSITHLLVISDTSETKKLAEKCFVHPQEDVAFALHHSQPSELNRDGITLREMTEDDVTSCGPQPAVSQKFSKIVRQSAPK